MVVVGAGGACDDVEVVDHGDAAQVEQVLAGAAVAGAASLPVPDVGEGVLDGVYPRDDEQMGEVLKATAQSVNIRERLDFS